MPLKRFIALLLAVLLAAITVGLPCLRALSAAVAIPSTYERLQQAPFNRPEHFPLDRRPDPSLYLPHASWMGRLILPEASEMAARPGDWVWMELQLTPPERREWVGQRVRLSWQDNPAAMDLIQAVTTDVHLGETARRYQRRGNVVATRLDGRRAVGPLQSLAGARPRDDVTVELQQVDISEEDAGIRGGNSAPSLRIGRSPVQITGRWMALVTILGRDSGKPAAESLYRVRHFNRASGRFDGPVESVRLPRQPPDRDGRRMFDPEGIESNPNGEDGWYLYGGVDRTGVFTAQALAPRRLFLLGSDGRIVGSAAGLRHINRENWRVGASSRGSLRRMALPTDEPWALGDRALLLHSFGGIGGSNGEPIRGFTVTGHFSFGEAQVVSDPFTGDPCLSIRYHQIYANNPNGIVAGTQDWSAYSGDLQRGWLWTRPISDVLIREDSELMPELATQAQVMMARYRTGDGTGVATVTPATSCVQDSAQALWIAIDQLRFRLRRRLEDPGFPARLEKGDLASRLQRLASLADQLERLLTPFGIVRQDWAANSSRLIAARSRSAPPAEADAMAASSPQGFQRGQSPAEVLLSLRSMMPRRAHDDLAKLFITRGADLRILRTNQLPGKDRSIEPLAPTLVLGQIPILATVLRRMVDAVFAPVTMVSWLQAGLLLGGFTVLVVPSGLRNGFLSRQRPHDRPASLIAHSAALFVMPAIVEELIFRVALLPHRYEGAAWWELAGWGLLSVGLYVAYHPAASRLWYPTARGVFDDPRFLVPCMWLGIQLSALYLLTGSLWMSALSHWIVVLAWLKGLGGDRLLHGRPRASAAMK